MRVNNRIILMELFEALSTMTLIDTVDWKMACSFAEKWKMSVADALLDLFFVDETTLAKALAKSQNLHYISGQNLKCDLSELDFEQIEDLLTVGAIPIVNDRLAICNPYDDLRGSLGSRLCQREMVVTKRSVLFETLRYYSINGWLEDDGF